MLADSQDLITSQLRKRRDEITARFGVRRLAISGSASRAELTENSDIDVLVEFEGRATFGRFMDLKFYLEVLLRRPVDLVTTNALRPELRPAIEAEAIDVA
jgi:hypothetical protein